MTPEEKYTFIHNFLPHAQRKTRARLIQNKAFFVYCLLLVAVFAIFSVVPKMYPGILGFASSISVGDLFKYANRTREEAGLADLRLNPELTKAAEAKAADMFKDDYWAHVSPKTGKEPWDFILAQDYDYSYAGENLAKNFSNSREVVDAWYNSPSHRENLLSKNYDEVGYAVVNGVLDGYKTTLVVQMFGRPRNPTYLASAEVEGKLLKDSAQKEQLAAVPLAQPISSQVGSVLPAMDVATMYKYIAGVFAGFVISLLALDIWYSKRKAIPKLTGHAFAHLTFFIAALVGVLFVFSPGKIL